MEGLIMSDSVFSSDEQKSIGELRPVNHWGGPFIEKTDEFGETILVPAVNFSEKDIDIWKKIG